jgi:capsular exopolysaccharide synthesis family protein
MDNDSTSFDVLRTLGQRAPLILLCLLATTAAAFAISKAQPREYQATASIDFHDPQANEVAAGLSVASVDHQVRVDTDLNLASLPRIAVATAAAIGGGLTSGSVQSSVTVTKQADSDLATVTATSTSPVLAARLANTYSVQIAADRQRASQAYYGGILRSLDLQIRALPPALRQGGQGAALRSRADSLQVLSQLEGRAAQVVDQAGVPTSPSSPQVARNAVLGAILGLMLGLALALLLGRFDRRVREPGELADVYDVPLIGVVPHSSALKVSTRSAVAQAPPAAVAETFALLWARIRYFNVDRQLDMLLIASAQPGEGKTTVARNLALAAAKVGPRVLLVECDLRSPSLGRQLGAQESPGISDVLLEGMAPDDAIQTVDVAQPPGRQLQLDVLVAGGLLPPDPAHVIESHAMEALLDRARATYDFVLIDAPPLAVVSDAFPLLQQASGVVVVGRIGRSRSDIAGRLRQTLASANAPLIGVIANDYRGRPGAAYGSDPHSPYVSGRQAPGGVPTGEAVRLAQSDGHDQVTHH